MGAWEDGFAAGWSAGLAAAYEPGSRNAHMLLSRGRAPPEQRSKTRAKPKRTRAPSAYNKRLGAAIRRINKRAKKKDGDYRKGWSRSKVFKMAHKEARRK